MIRPDVRSEIADIIARTESNLNFTENRGATVGGGALKTLNISSFPPPASTYAPPHCAADADMHAVRDEVAALKEVLLSHEAFRAQRSMSQFPNGTLGGPSPPPMRPSETAVDVSRRAAAAEEAAVHCGSRVFTLGARIERAEEAVGQLKEEIAAAQRTFATTLSVKDDVASLSRAKEDDKQRISGLTARVDSLSKEMADGVAVAQSAVRRTGVAEEAVGRLRDDVRGMRDDVAMISALKDEITSLQRLREEDRQRTASLAAQVQSLQRAVVEATGAAESAARRSAAEVTAAVKGEVMVEVGRAVDEVGRLRGDVQEVVVKARQESVAVCRGVREELLSATTRLKDEMTATRSLVEGQRGLKAEVESAVAAAAAAKDVAAEAASGVTSCTKRCDDLQRGVSAATTAATAVKEAALAAVREVEDSLTQSIASTQKTLAEELRRVSTKAHSEAERSSRNAAEALERVNDALVSRMDATETIVSKVSEAHAVVGVLRVQAESLAKGLDSLMTWQGEVGAHLAKLDSKTAAAAAAAAAASAAPSSGGGRTEGETTAAVSAAAASALSVANDANSAATVATEGVAAVREMVSKVKADVRSLQSEVAALRSLKTDVDAAVAQLGAETSQRATTVSNLKRLNGDVERLREEDVSLRDAVSATAAQTEALAAQVDRTYRALDAIPSNIAAVKAMAERALSEAAAAAAVAEKSTATSTAVSCAVASFKTALAVHRDTATDAAAKATAAAEAAAEAADAAARSMTAMSIFRSRKAADTTAYDGPSRALSLPPTPSDTLTRRRLEEDAPSDNRSGSSERDGDGARRVADRDAKPRGGRGGRNSEATNARLDKLDVTLQKLAEVVSTSAAAAAAREGSGSGRGVRGGRARAESQRVYTARGLRGALSAAAVGASGASHGASTKPPRQGGVRPSWPPDSSSTSYIEEASRGRGRGRTAGDAAVPPQRAGEDGGDARATSVVASGKLPRSPSSAAGNGQPPAAGTSASSSVVTPSRSPPETQPSTVVVPIATDAHRRSGSANRPPSAFTAALLPRQRSGESGADLIPPTSPVMSVMRSNSSALVPPSAEVSGASEAEAASLGHQVPARGRSGGGEGEGTLGVSESHPSGAILPASRRPSATSRPPTGRPAGELEGLPRSVSVDASSLGGAVEVLGRGDSGRVGREGVSGSVTQRAHTAPSGEGREEVSCSESEAHDAILNTAMALAGQLSAHAHAHSHHRYGGGPGGFGSLRSPRRAQSAELDGGEGALGATGGAVYDVVASPGGSASNAARQAYDDSLNAAVASAMALVQASEALDDNDSVVPDVDIGDGEFTTTECESGA